MNLEADVGEESMEEDTEDEDHQATTPDLVREFSDLVEYGDPVETLSLVLNSSSDDQTKQVAAADARDDEDEAGEA